MYAPPRLADGLAPNATGVNLDLSGFVRAAVASIGPGGGFSPGRVLTVDGDSLLDGDMSLTGQVDSDLAMATGSVVVLDPSTSVADCPLQFGGDPNTGIVRNGADEMGLIAGGAEKHRISAAGSGAIANLLLSNHLIGSNGTYIELVETAAPAAPAADRVRVFAVDSGGKTQLSTKFATGAAQPVTTEP